MGAGRATPPAPYQPGGKAGEPARFRLQGHGGQSLLRPLLAVMVVVMLMLPAGCSRPSAKRTAAAPAAVLSPQRPSGRLQEVAPPAAVQQLQAALADRAPLVAILEPRDGSSLGSGPATLRLQVRDWPLVDAGPLGLGPHVVVQLDDQPPLRLTGPAAGPTPVELQLDLPPLSPGSHRITAYAARPWGEAVKSPGAWDQIRVHRVAANPLAIPAVGSPQLIPVSPAELGSQQPVLLDWLLLDAPLQGLRDNDGSWRLRVTVNGDSFLVDQNAPLWLKGWQGGSNSLVLELVDGQGAPLNPPFNTVVRELVLNTAGPAPIWQQGSLAPNVLAQLLGTLPPPPAEPAEPAPSQEAPSPRAETPPEPTPEPTPAGTPPPASTSLVPAESQRGAQSAAPTVAQSAAESEAKSEDPSEIQPDPEPEPHPAADGAPDAPPSPAPPMPAPSPARPRPPAAGERIAPSTSLEGSARAQVNPDGSLLKPQPKGPLAGLRQKLGK